MYTCMDKTKNSPSPCDQWQKVQAYLFCFTLFHSPNKNVAEGDVTLQSHPKGCKSAQCEQVQKKSKLINTGTLVLNWSRYDLVSLFNDISTFMGYLMPILSL